MIDGVVTQFTEQHGLTDRRVLSLYEDREGKHSGKSYAVFGSDADQDLLQGLPERLQALVG